MAPRASITGFVVVDMAARDILTYDGLRDVGIIAPYLETAYLEGKHGINGLIQLTSGDDTSLSAEGMVDEDLAVAQVTVPFFSDGRLAAEPCGTFETGLMHGYEHGGEPIVELSHLQSGCLQATLPGGVADSIAVTLYAKVSGLEIGAPATGPLIVRAHACLYEKFGVLPPNERTAIHDNLCQEVPLPKKDADPSDEPKSSTGASKVPLYREMFPRF